MSAWRRANMTSWSARGGRRDQRRHLRLYGRHRPAFLIGTCLLITMMTSLPPTSAEGDDTAVSASRARRRLLKLTAVTWNTFQQGEDDQQIADVLYRTAGKENGRLGIVGLQEMCFKDINDVVETTNRLEEQSGRDWSFWDSRPWGDLRRGACENGNALIVSREQPHTSVENIVRRPYPTQDEENCPRLHDPNNNDECRSYVRVDLVLRGARIRVYSTHLDNDKASIRAQQVKELVEDIREEKAPRIPRIVMGDFNARPDDAALDPMYDLFRDVLGRRNNTPTGGAGPCPALSGNRIDFVFVRRLGVQTANVQPLADDDNPSDHCPVVAHLRIRI